MKPRRSTSIARLVALLLLALPFAACDGDPGTARANILEEFELDDPEVELPDVEFRDVTREAGIDFTHVTGAFGKKYLPETMGSGVLFFDYDGDYWPDLLFVNGDRWPGRDGEEPATPALYRNRRDGTFEDVTEAAGLDFSLYGMGAAAGDVDGDGDADLYLTAWGDNRLLVNEDGRFVDRTAAAGVAGARWTDEAGREHPEWSVGAVFFDYDLDGDLDLFVANYVKWSIETDLHMTLDGVTKAYTTPEKYPGLFPRLYANRGDGTFEDASDRLEFGPEAEPKALGAIVTDYDGDGRPDLFVTNDTQRNNLLRNRPDGTFVEAPIETGVAFDENGRARAGMGVGETVLPDGEVGLVVGNFSQEAVAFFRRLPTGLFIDSAGRARLSGPTLPTLTFGLLFLDYDLDGREDLVLANGHLEPTIQEVHPAISYRQPPQLFRNRDGLRFDDASRSVGEDFREPMVARGVATADYDRDGDPDLAFSQNGGPAVLFRNDGATGNRSLRIRLAQESGNRDAIGARIVVTAGGFDRVRSVRAGGSYLSRDGLTQVVGLGAADRAERVRVVWPDGEEETFEDVAAGREILIVKGKGIRDLPR